MKNTKGRDSNFELLRIVAMMLVMLVHANYLSLGTVTQAELHATPWTGFVRIVCEQLCIVSVNLFVLLSGWFGIRPTVKKFASLLFQILFIGLVTVELCRVSGVEVPARAFNDLLYFGASYWFVPAYMILFCIAPVLNSFAEHASKREFAGVLAAFFALQMLFGWLTYDYGHFARGYSAMSFVGLYLLAQFVRRHGERLRSLKWWQHLAFYLLFTAIPVAISTFGIWTKGKELGATMYSSLFVVAASMSLFLVFDKMRFESKAVNWLASSAFAIYLVHQAPGAFDLYQKVFSTAYAELHGAWFIPFTLAATLAIGLGAILLDKVRIVAWELTLRLKTKLVK